MKNLLLVLKKINFLFVRMDYPIVICSNFIEYFPYKNSLLPKIFKAIYTFGRLSSLKPRPKLLYLTMNLEDKNFAAQKVSMENRIDPWVPRYHTLKSQYGGIVDEMLNAIISCLINSIIKGWDINRDKAQFNPIIAVEILKIVVGSNQHIYKWIWTKDGEVKFSVRYAYRLVKNIQKESLSKSFVAHNHTSFWKMLWRLQKSRSLHREHAMTIYQPSKTRKREM